MFTTPRVIAALVILLAIVSALVWIYRQGGNDVRTAIERQNNEAGDQSDRARSDYDACVDGGGVYDFGARKCRRPAPGGRN